MPQKRCWVAIVLRLLCFLFQSQFPSHADDAFLSHSHTVRVCAIANFSKLCLSLGEDDEEDDEDIDNEEEQDEKSGLPQGARATLRPFLPRVIQQCSVILNSQEAHQQDVIESLVDSFMFIVQADPTITASLEAHITPLGALHELPGFLLLKPVLLIRAFALPVVDAQTTNSASYMGSLWSCGSPYSGRGLRGHEGDCKECIGPCSDAAEGGSHFHECPCACQHQSARDRAER